MGINILGSGYYETESEATTFSADYTCHSGSDRKLLAAILVDGNSSSVSVNSFSYNGKSFTEEVAPAYNSIGDYLVGLYYLDDLPTGGGSCTISATLSETAHICFVILELSGAKQGPAADSAAETTSTSSTNLDISVTSTSRDSLMFLAGLYGASSGSWSSSMDDGSDKTDIVMEPGYGATWGGSYAIDNVPGSFTSTFTASTNRYMMAVSAAISPSFSFSGTGVSVEASASGGSWNTLDNFSGTGVSVEASASRGSWRFVSSDRASAEVYKPNGVWTSGPLAPFRGTLKKAFIFNRVLTAEEIKSLYNRARIG